MTKIAFITGATAGIGKACAIKLAKTGYDVILSGRREDQLNLLKTEIQSKYHQKVLSLVLDVRNQSDVNETINKLPIEWKQIDLLLNNAGLAVGVSSLQDGVIDDWERMIDTNIKGLLYITRALSPMMIKRKHGHIINITSIAGKEVYPGGNVYCATKHAVDALTKGMRIDMLEHNIKVSSIAPGMVETEFSIVRFKGDKEKADQVYKGFTPLYAEDIADAVEFIATRPDHVNINDMLIMPTAQASARDVNKK
ncbi:SDR family NAD(P)-dependent oxidoreductase [Ancylomarina longa]|uniref:SDR family NAD(P)-dependent oxidoreductase n=1 Tax=Ancylomarina longa TaxID=2487017 RepID=A0A434ATS1_9BACT|nr:SDR family NAD(P)-dependent oxidoreductase [Ancylomarina longa]RUT77815.1 SDR family NAD(P)-dependent oxidoreductase [Ancylomarina longa]